MRGTKAKRIRREHQDAGMATKAKKYYRYGGTGQIISDADRRAYQMRKEAA